MLFFTCRLKGVAIDRNLNEVLSKLENPSCEADITHIKGKSPTKVFPFSFSSNKDILFNLGLTVRQIIETDKTKKKN